MIADKRMGDGVSPAIQGNEFYYLPKPNDQIRRGEVYDIFQRVEVASLPSLR